jgi:hypothetical protein
LCRSFLSMDRVFRADAVTSYVKSSCDVKWSARRYIKIEALFKGKYGEPLKNRFVSLSNYLRTWRHKNRLERQPRGVCGASDVTHIYARTTISDVTNGGVTNGGGEQLVTSQIVLCDLRDH